MALHVLQCLAAVLSAFACLAHGANGDFFRIPSPWVWQCDQGRCVKTDPRGAAGLLPLEATTLNACKLTCGTAGTLWPRPKMANIGTEIFLFLPDNMNLQTTCTGEVCSLLLQAFDIFKNNLERYHPDFADGSAPWMGPWELTTLAHTLEVDVTVASSDVALSLSTDESYDLTVTNTNSSSTSAIIIAPTYYGARHAMETLSQLISYHEFADALMVVVGGVTDVAAFPYRGLMVDTARNYLSVESLKRTLDVMAANKLNTLHWHITDTQSFPLILDSLPNMALYGAYSSRQVYTPAQVRDLVKYAKIRGVRLLPEFDAPAHVGYGWQWAEKEGMGKLVVCVNKEPWQEFCVQPPCGQLNLANPAMYDVLGQIYKDLVQLFSPLQLFHFGGDEINLNCWNTTEEVFNWMVDSNHGTDEAAYYAQWAVFQERARQLLKDAVGGEVEVPGVMWSSHLTDPAYLESSLNSSQYIIQYWLEKNNSAIEKILSRGYRMIISNYDAWYLDCGMGAWVGEGFNWCSPYKSWQVVYDNSPIDIAGIQYKDLILGGEAAIWMEQTDDATIDAKLWPRGAALAERLWTDPDTTHSAAEYRFIHHRQRLVQRGVQADRIQPEWCHQNEGSCYIKPV